MKKFVLILLSMCLCLSLFVACEVNTENVFFRNCVRSSTNTSCKAHYAEYSGIQTFTIKVAENETREVVVSIVTESGSLAVTIDKIGEKAAYTGHDIPTSDFTVILSEPGTFTLRLEGNHHSGSYSFDWSKTHA